MKVSLIGQMRRGRPRNRRCDSGFTRSMMRKGKMAFRPKPNLLNCSANPGGAGELGVFLKRTRELLRAMIVAKIADPLMEEAMKIS